MDMSKDRIIVHFKVEKPIEIVELTKALAGIGRSYDRVLKSEGLVGDYLEDYRLYVTKIEKNCILTELAGAAMTALPVAGVISYHNNFVQFVSYMKTYIDWFRGEKTLEKPPGKQETQDIASVLSLAASDDGKGDLNFEHVEYHDTGKRKSVYKLSYNPKQVNSAYSGAIEHLASLDAEDREIYKDVVLEIAVLDIKRSANNRRTYDRGVIAQISKIETRVSWESELDGMRVKSPESKLKNMEYIVDVQVVRNSKGVPRIYRVLSVNDIV